jgi:hypothetical protein
MLVFCVAVLMAVNAHGQTPDPTKDGAKTPAAAVVPDSPTESDKPAVPDADEAPSPSARKKAKAAKYYMEGQKLYSQELYLSALRVFSKSYELFQTPPTLYNMAKCYEKLGEAEKCIEGFERYVDSYRKKNAKEPPDIIDIKNAMSKCRLGLRLEVTIESDPLGASVYLDDTQVLVGQTPLKTSVDPGSYTLYLKADGHVALTRTIVIRQGESRKLFFKLEPLRKAGRVKIDCNIAGASIFLNGRNVGRTPFREHLVLKEGLHQILVEKEDYVSVNRSLTVKADQGYIVDAGMWLKNPPSTWKGPVGWTSLIVGALLMGGGYGAGYYADTLFTGTPDFDLYAMLQQVGYGAGGGLAGIGLTLLIWEAVGGNAIKAKDAITEFQAPKGLTLHPLVRVEARRAIFGADVRF